MDEDNQVTQIYSTFTMLKTLSKIAVKLYILKKKLCNFTTGFGLSVYLGRIDCFCVGYSNYNYIQ